MVVPIEALKSSQRVTAEEISKHRIGAAKQAVYFIFIATRYGARGRCLAEETRETRKSIGEEYNR